MQDLSKQSLHGESNSYVLLALVIDAYISDLYLILL